jgi:hypothetical protein
MKTALRRFLVSDQCDPLAPLENDTLQPADRR